ncbi:hypothetical protein CL656_06920 [bacterium]|nr:hypothetical protein [bacterium]
MTFVGYIPARAGSIRLKNKNFLDFFNGQSITEIALNKSNQCSTIKYTILDTDNVSFLDEMYKKNLTDYNHLRSDSLSSSEITTAQALRDCIIKAENIFKNKISNIVVLQPSSPLISLDSINIAIDKFIKNDLELVASFTRLPINLKDCFQINENEIKKFGNSEINEENILFETGGIYIISKKRLFNSENPFQVDALSGISIIPLNEYVDIDYYDQFLLAQRLYIEI